MKLHLILAVLTAILFASATPELYAASNATSAPAHVVSATTATHFKKERKKSRLRNWWENKAQRFFQKAKLLVQRISLGFVGFIVTLVGAMFIVLGLVIPGVGILFLVLGIIIAFVGIILWILLSMIGVRVSTSDGRDRRAN